MHTLHSDRKTCPWLNGGAYKGVSIGSGTCLDGRDFFQHHSMQFSKVCKSKVPSSLTWDKFRDNSRDATHPLRCDRKAAHQG